MSGVYMKFNLDLIISPYIQTLHLSLKQAMLHLNCRVKWTALLYHSPPNLQNDNKGSRWTIAANPQIGNSHILTSNLEDRKVHCNARRRVRYEEGDQDEDQEYGYNEEIAMLEVYSQSARGEALLVRATVDGQEEQVLVFKGFSSSLSYGTAPDLSKSVLPARAVIKSIDRIKGPFDPSNIEYIEPGLSWEAFRNRIRHE